MWIQYKVPTRRSTSSTTDFLFATSWQALHSEYGYLRPITSIFNPSIELFLSGKSLVFINRFQLLFYSHFRTAEGLYEGCGAASLFLFKFPDPVLAFCHKIILAGRLLCGRCGAEFYFVQIRSIIHFSDSLSLPNFGVRLSAPYKIKSQTFPYYISMYMQKQTEKSRPGYFRICPFP